MKPWSAPIVMLLSSCSPPADDGEGVGAVSLSLSAEVCAVYCAAEVRAELFREGGLLPLGPAAQEACGEALRFDELPAGTRVRLAVAVFDEAGERRLEGESEALTIAAGEDVVATVSVHALHPPVIEAVTPDPVVAADGDGIVAITGRELGGGNGGLDQVFLAEEVLGGVVWGDGVTATVPAGAHGGDLVITSCGIASTPWSLRVIGPSVGVAPVPQAPGCPGRRVAAMVPIGADLIVAFACDDAASSYLERFRTDGACPLDGGEVWPLGAAPTALAPGWVGLAGVGVASFDPAAAGAVTTVHAATRVDALAVSQGRVVALADGALRRVDQGFEAVPGVDGSLLLLGLAASGDEVLALASFDNQARVIELPLAAGETAKTFSVVECVGPGTFAAAGDDVVLGCVPDLVALDRQSGIVDVLASSADTFYGVAFDPRGDVAFGWAPDRLVAADLDSGQALHTWPAPEADGPGLVALGERLVAAGGAPGSLVVWTPYDGGGPCP